MNTIYISQSFKYMNILYKHILSLIVFIFLTITLFHPIFFENKNIKQHDIEQWKYSANETIEFRKNSNEEALWSNSMFSGMPNLFSKIASQNGVIKLFYIYIKSIVYSSLTR